MNRSIAPLYYPAEDLKLIFPEKIELHNGTVLYWLKDVKDDSVKLDIEWVAGSKHQKKKLVAGFTNKLLLSGSDELSAREIAEEIDFYGGYTQAQADKDHAGISVFGLVENIEAIFSVVKRALAVAGFPQNELTKELNIALNKFKVESQKVKVVCRREFNKKLFGDASKYGQVAEEADYTKLKREDLLAFFNQRYKVAPVIFLTGNVPAGFIETLREWSATFRVSTLQPVEQRFEQLKGQVNVPKKDALQTAIRIGRLMFDKQHPDYFKFQLLNTILGGYFGSRLMTNIREDKGYTYGIGSGMAVMEDAGYFYITTEVGAEVKDNAVREIFNELNRLKENPVSEDELIKVKNYMLGEFLRHADGPMALMEVFKNIFYNQLEDTYYSDFISAIHDTTPEDLQLLAQKYFVREEMLEVVAG